MGCDVQFLMTLEMDLGGVPSGLDLVNVPSDLDWVCVPSDLGCAPSDLGLVPSGHGHGVTALLDLIPRVCCVD